ncbi:hypothetical protein ACFLWG_00145 [Chloroflexota bacterium]
MNKEITNWLLEGPAWLKFAVEKQHLVADPNPEIVVNDSAITKLRQRLDDNLLGLPALKAGRLSAETTGNAYWDLFFLADIGFAAGDLNLNHYLDGILNRQSKDGTYSLYHGMAHYYFCLSAILIATIAKMGYRDDTRVKRFVQTVWNARCRDGGWHCEGWEKTGCPMDNLNILMLLGQYEQYINNPECNEAVDLLLKHWERRGEGWRKDGFGIGRRFMSLEYPAIKYGILRVLDVLSLFPSVTKKPGFKTMLNFVQEKSTDGRYFAETTSDAYKDFDFGQKKEPSRWITFLISRVEKRVYK